MGLAKVSAWFTGVPVRRFTFRMADMRDENNESIRWRILFGNMAHVQAIAADAPSFQKFIENAGETGLFSEFLFKNLVSISEAKRGDLVRGLHLVKVCQWQVNNVISETIPESSTDRANAVLFTERMPWLDALKQFAEGCGIDIVPVRRSMDIAANWRRMLPLWAVSTLRNIKYSQRQKPAGNTETTAAPSPTANDDQNRPRLALDYYGQGNPNNPERHSDLFFWQQSSLEGPDLLCLLPFPNMPLGQQTWNELKEHKIGAIRLHTGAATASDVPLFTPDKETKPNEIRVGQNPERQWLNRQLTNYQRLKNNWIDLATQQNIKVYLTWYKYNADHFAIADALETTGGVTAIYQRGVELLPAAQNAISADITFGFSPDVAEVERQANSKIRYHVTTGYMGDHRFPLVKEDARRIREQLLNNGATRILAYLDENSANDARWGVGHHLPQVNYTFLLEKLLAEPWLGLVIKPKVPATLRRRLGDVAELLQRAEATGRCYVHEARGNDPFQGSHPPAEAALASDLTIHGDLGAATAGFETALAGVPTLLHDPESSPSSPLYRLGIGKVVFGDWESLWEACQQHWSSPNGIPGFGDWTPVLDEMDPFRDGKAAERMGDYVKWLLEGFRTGLDRDTVMANAAERYCAAWGSDKITQVNWDKNSSKRLAKITG